MRKFVANLKSISDNFMQIPLFQCPLLQISEKQRNIGESGRVPLLGMALGDMDQDASPTLRVPLEAAGMGITGD